MKRSRSVHREISRQQWSFILDLCQEALRLLIPRFTEASIDCIPLNAAYFCRTSYIYHVPPFYPFEIYFLVNEDQLDSAIKEVLTIDRTPSTITKNKKNEIVLNLGHAIHLKVILKSHFQPCLFSSHIPFNQMAARTSRDGTCLFVTQEEALCVLLCSVISFQGIHATAAISSLLGAFEGVSGFYWERFWQLCTHQYPLRKALTIALIKQGNQTLLTKSAIRCSPAIQLLASLPQPLFCLLPLPFITTVAGFLTASQPLRYLREKTLHCIFSGAVAIRKRVLNTFLETMVKRSFTKHEIRTADRLALSQRMLLKSFEIPADFRLSCLIGTSSGIWMLHNSHMTQLTIGPTYGITRSGALWYAMQGLGTYSRIISFFLHDDAVSPRVLNQTTIVSGLDSAVHQIDIHDGFLYVVDTFNDRIVVYSKNRKKAEYYPIGKSLFSQHHDRRHFNSVFIQESTLLVMAHNGPKGANYPSELFLLDKKSKKVLAVYTLPAFKAHNIIPCFKEFLICNSESGEVKLGNRVILQNTGLFLRGLSVTKKGIIVGGSEIKPRHERHDAKSSVLLLDYNGTLKCLANFNLIGQIFEIRAYDQVDFGLSHDYRAAAIENLFNSSQKTSIQEIKIENDTYDESITR
ncbi:MAG: hypothetical protein JW795_17040 [Chitinivibrionales bacterium]|nr:hypothetical protein [Chitinivibrionales bacterium]